MGYSNSDSGDLDKLRQALGDVTAAFGSVEGLLEAFGLKDLPVAQRYGIVLGICTFVCTVSAVLLLLIAGGSFQRIQQQAETGEPTLLSPTDARKQRALLLEQLLESRQWMIQRNYGNNDDDNHNRSTPFTPLTSMLMTEAPPSAHQLPNLLLSGNTEEHEAKLREIRDKMPENYEDNYKHAYRACQDSPGGPVLSGRPEARYEAYARAYAGCGNHTATWYRRSFARVYEATACHSLANDTSYNKLFEEHPHDIVGRFVHLQPLSEENHLDEFWKLTNGEPTLQYKSYDPHELWGFQPEGPFSTKKELQHSFVFQRKTREAAFAIRHNITDELIGCVWLTNDDPDNLKVQLEPPVIGFKFHGTALELEACFLLMDRLFAFGYRRIQYSTDAQDVVLRKLAARLGFTLEGCLFKHLIVKESSRDSNIYGMLNSDWKRGARIALFSKLYGKPAAMADNSNEAKEAEREEQQWNLLQQKKEQQNSNKTGTTSAAVPATTSGKKKP